MKRLKTKVTAMVLALTMVFAMAPLMGAQKAYAITDSGTIGMNLANQAYSFSSETEAVKLGLCFRTLAYNGDITITKESLTGSNSSVSYDVNGDDVADVYCTSKVNENYRPTRSEYGMTSSCTAKGIMGFSVSKEQVEAYIATLEEGVYADSDSYYSRVELDFGGSAIVEPEVRLKDLGIYTFDLSKGTKKMFFDDSKMSSEMMVVFYMMQEGGYFYGESGSAEGKTKIDLDGHGEAFDLEMYGEDSGGTEESFTVCFDKLSTSNIKDSYTVMLTAEDKEFFETWAEAPESLTGYYSGIKFVFNEEAPVPAPVAKAANTLTLKGKTFKVNAKKLKKKAKKFSIAKVVNVTGAQGAVTYAKKSGNKKITISKTGKVTVKKKLKKGTYRVKVNVTAAGNDAYDPATKTVTFKVKVK